MSESSDGCHGPRAGRKPKVTGGSGGVFSRGSEHGSITVLAASTCAVVMFLLLILSGLILVRVERSRAQSVADIAALSAGPQLADGCQWAARLVERNGMQLTGCERHGLDLLVTVSVPVARFGVVTVAARAAPYFAEPLAP